MEASLPPICPAPRVLRACENCRTRRLRCLPSTKTGTCQRCLSARASCVFSGGNHERRPQGRRNQKQQPTEGRNPSTDSVLADGNILTGLFTTSPKTETDRLGDLQSLHRRVFEGLFPQASNQPSNANVAKNLDLPTGLQSLPQQPTRSGLDSKEAEKYLTRYQDLRGYFPFVVLPENWNLSLMLREHRFLLLGVLSAMSASNLQLHSWLDAEFRRVFSEKVVVHGEKSLDILQGLLVYIAWYPLHLNPRNAQVFQYLQLAITLVIDLKYNNAPDRDTEDLVSIRRAYLGCCYLSSALSISSKRPNNLSFGAYTDICLQHLVEHPVCKTDQLLVSYIMLQRISEEAATARLNNLHLSPRMDGISIDDCVSSFQSRIRRIESTASMDLLNYPPLRLLKFFVVMRVGAIALFPESNYLRSIQPVTSPRGSLAGYLQPTKSLFENFLSIPISEYRNFSMLEWTRLIQTIISLISTCLAMVAAPEVDSIDADQASHFGIYLESLCFRMDELTTVTKDTKTGPDIFCMFKSVLRIVRGTYEEMIMKISRKSDCGGGEEQMSRFPSICPMLNGSIRRTEYWNVLNNSDTNSAFDDDCMASGIAGFGLLPYFESWDTWELGVADSSDLPFYD